MDTKRFCFNLRLARKRLGLSQKDLAEQMNVSPQAISKWERGDAMPDLERAYTLSRLLHLSLDEMLGVNNDQEEAVIGIDGGGTKTEFVMIATDGRLLKRMVLPGCNPNICTVEESFNILCRGIDALLQEGKRILAINVGASGFLSGKNGELVEERLKKNYPGIPLRCESDICNVLACAEDPENAIAVICGTGAVVFATKKGHLMRFGGGGWRLEVLGSGYDIGRSAILAAMEARDGVGPETRLLAEVEQKLGDTVWNKIPFLYQEPAATIADFAPLVFRAQMEGDAVAEKIVTENANRLAELILTALRHSPDAKQILLGGSILTKRQEFQDRVLKQLPADLRAGTLPYPQCWGACKRAANLAKIDDPDVNLFMNRYEQEVNHATY